MPNMIRERLERLFSECDKHVLRMNSAKAKLAAQALNTIFDSKSLLESVYLGLKEAYFSRK